MLEEALDEKGAARYLGVKPPTMRAWRHAGRGPRYFKAGRLVRYERAELDAFISRNSFGGSD